MSLVVVSPEFVDSSTMKFAETIDEIKSSEKSIKQTKIKLKREAHYTAARKKLKLRSNSKIYKHHATKLTLEQMKVIIYVYLHTHVHSNHIKHLIRLWRLSIVEV